MRALWICLLVVGFSGCFEDDDAETDDGVIEPEAPVVDDNETAPEEVTRDVTLSGAYPATIAYSPDSVSVPAGSMVTIRFSNTDTNPLVNHDWVLEGVDGAATEVIGNGETDDVTFMAPPPGEYTFYCSVPGHRGNGMEGTFTVTA